VARGFVKDSEEHSQYKVQRIIFFVFLLVALVEIKNKSRYGCRRAEIRLQSVCFPLIEVITKILCVMGS
jgi:hypothetical protein